MEAQFSNNIIEIEGLEEQGRASKRTQNSFLLDVQMPVSKAKGLSSLFRSAIKTTSKSCPQTSPAEDATLKQFVSSLDTSFPPRTSLLEALPKRSNKTSKSLPKSKSSSPKKLPSLELEKAPCSGDSTKQLWNEISDIVCAGTSAFSSYTQGTGDDKTLEKLLDLPSFSSISHNNISMRRLEVLRERKQKCVFKSTHYNRFDRLVNMCAQKLGTEATIRVFGKLGRETGVKEFNILIKICVEKARTADDEEVALEQIYKAFQLFKSIKEQGFELEDGTYGPFLMYLIDMGMIEEFQFFQGIIKTENPSSLSRLGYYEMLLWIRVENEEKIQELCKYVAVDDGEDKSDLKANYLLALCENDRNEEVMQLLEIIDITKIPSLDYAASVFKSLGRQLLESLAEKFLFTFKSCDYGAENIANFIFSYAVSIPNIAVEDVISKFKNLHAKLEMAPSSASYENLITYCCDSFKVHLALNLVDEMFDAGLTLSIEAIHSILHASEESYEFNLVHQIYSVICRHNLKPNNETFRSMISLSVKMKDFSGAYGMINDLKKMNLMPTANMYNAIMVGYFREKNIDGGLEVLKEMESADVKPDSQTFSYLISNCDREEDIIKYYEELKCTGIQVTKHVFMALINAYTNCGQFEKAKQIMTDKGVPVKDFNDIKSVLVSALASQGQISDALDIYGEIKQAGYNLEPRSAIRLIEHLQSEGELSRLLQLLKELNVHDYWVDGCCRIILYCIRHKHLSSAVDLLKQLKNTFRDDELVTEMLLDEVFCFIAETESLQIGLDLLQVIKDELRMTPSRKCLDFLLSACVNSKDLHNSFLIWKEYQAAGLPYNVLSFLRMYQALLASGDVKSAKIMLNRIPRDDPHVRSVIKMLQTTYVESTYVVKGKKKESRDKKLT